MHLYQAYFRQTYINSHIKFIIPKRGIQKYMGFKTCIILSMYLARQSEQHFNDLKNLFENIVRYNI